MNNVNTVKAAKKGQYHFGYTGAIEEAKEMSPARIEYSILKAERFANLNREKRKIDAAHYYEGRAKGFEDALTGM